MVSSSVEGAVYGADSPGDPDSAAADASPFSSLVCDAADVDAAGGTGSELDSSGWGVVATGSVDGAVPVWRHCSPGDCCLDFPVVDHS